MLRNLLFPAASLLAVVGQASALPLVPGDIVISGVSSGGGIVRMDPVTGSVTPIATVGSNAGNIALEPGGTILVFQGSTHEFLRVDPTSGNTSVVDPGSFSSISDFEVAPDGGIFISGVLGGGGIVRMDPVTGSVTPIATVGSNAGNIALEPGGTILVFQGSTHEFLRVDPTSGNTSVVDPGSFSSISDFAVLQVPEPGPVLEVLAGLALLCLARRHSQGQQDESPAADSVDSRAPGHR